MDNKCTVLVNSCDAYEDLWEPFFTLFKIYWRDCPYEIILNTESKEYRDESLNVKAFQFYSAFKKVPYGKRIRKCLKEIKTPYTLLMLDDFFLREQVEQKKLEEVMSYMDGNSDIICFNFDVQHDKYDINDERFPGFYKRSLYGTYRYNMQAGIWRTKELYNAWKDKESPWQWELYGNVRSWQKGKNIYVLRGGEKNPIEYGYYPGPRGVYRGKWVLEDVKPLFEKHNIKVDYSFRGIYKDVLEVIAPKNLYAQKLYSYGIYRFSMCTIWYIKEKVVSKLKRIKPNFSYSDYLNGKKYKDSNSLKE